MFENIEYLFLKDLNDKQKNICLSEDNFILTACPGSGKTKTIIYRLAYMARKYEYSRKLNIAITYTNRAAEEIENRMMNLGIDTSNVWTGTIHQFCMQFIIRPYSMYLPRLSKGYRIIDEYESEKYLKDIATSMGYNNRYVSDLLNNPIIMEKYLNIMEKNREIDFDMILQYSLELVVSKKFIAENVGMLIRCIHVDEYQDTNENQYQILACIVRANLHINILFVGDTNQAIYGSLGGIAKSPDEIRRLFPVDFVEECLDGCYRSTQRIIDYYSNFEISDTGAKSIASIAKKDGIIVLDQKTHKDDLASMIFMILKSQLNVGIPENEICIIAPQWYQIFPLANKLKKLMPNINFDAPNISPIKYDPLNVFFLIAKLLYTQNNGYFEIRKRIATEIFSVFEVDFNIAISDKIDKFDLLKAINSTKFIEDDGIKTLTYAIKNVYSLLEINEAREPKLKLGKNNFINKTNDRIKKYGLEYNCSEMKRCFKERTGIVISTIHGIKGEEFTTVIAFDLLRGHLPNWKTIRERSKQYCFEETCKLIYVICSRARENLYLIAERGRVTKSGGEPLVTTFELVNYRFKYNDMEQIISLFHDVNSKGIEGIMFV